MLLLLSVRANSRNLHTSSKSENFLCDLCDYKTTDSRRLRNHTNFVHLGKRVPCPECDQELANSGSLAIHMANKHQGITHSCPECEFVSSIKSSIKRHVQSVHQGIRYPCDQCDFLATSVYNLRKHRRRKHNIEIQASAWNHACNTRQKYSREKILHQTAVHFLNMNQPKKVTNDLVFDQCDACDYSFFSGTQQMVHRVRDHFGVRGMRHFL